MPRTKLTYKSQYVTIYLVITRMFFFGCDISLPQRWDRTCVSMFFPLGTWDGDIQLTDHDPQIFASWVPICTKWTPPNDT